jgi:hypothetical protein
MNISRYIAFAVLMIPILAIAADTPAPTLAGQTFGRSALLGLQLAVKRAHAEGKIAAPVAACVADLKPDSFSDVFDALLASELTDEERQTTEAFFKSPVGVKYAKHGMLQVYGAVGEVAPEPLPVFTDAELQEVQNYGKTSAGQKLVTQKVLEKASVQPVGQRVKELIAQCNAQK